MRWYDSETGRWLSKDPIRFGGGLNLYAFCGCEPILNIDSWGLWTVQLGLSGIGGAGNGLTTGFGIVFGYSNARGFQVGAYGFVGDGVYVSVGGGASIDVSISPNDDICDLNGISQSIGGSGLTAFGTFGLEICFPLPVSNEGPIPLPTVTGSWGLSTPLPEVHSFVVATGVIDIWRSR